MRICGPAESRIVRQDGLDHHDVLRRAWSVRQGPHGRAVHFGDSSVEFKVAKFYEVAKLDAVLDADVLVLMRKVFVWFCEPVVHQRFKR